MGAVLAAIVVFSAIRKRESEVQRAMAHTVEIVVAAADLPVGTKLAPGDLKLVRWARDSVPLGAFTDPQAVTGSFAKNDFVANQPVVASNLFIGDKTSGVMPLLIPAGMRAMSIPVDEVSDIAGFVAPQTHVDILVAVAGTGPGEPSFSRIVLQNIEVLAVAQEIEHVKDEPEVVKVVTLLLTPADAEKLTLASREGMLRLAMRNYSDAGIVPTPGIALTELLHPGASGATAPSIIQRQSERLAVRPALGPAPMRIEVMRDGKSAEALSFIRSGAGMRPSFQAQAAAPAIAEPQAPPAPQLPETSESPVSAAKPVWSASFTAPPPSAFAAVRDDALNRRNFASPLRPGDPGYQPEPRSYEVR